MSIASVWALRAPGKIAIRFAVAWASLGGCFVWAADGKPGEGGPPPAAVNDTIFIRREPLQVLDPAKYRAALVLRPYMQVDVSAAMDGVVRRVSIKLNQKVQNQIEAVSLDSTQFKLALQRAQVALKIATLKLEGLGDGADARVKEIAQAEADIAKFDVEIAQHQLDRCVARIPFAGEVYKIHVVEGQSVRAGDPLFSVGDPTRLLLEAPVDRKTVEPDQPFAFKVEANEVTGRLESIVPLPERFGPLRELFESVAGAQILLDNSNGKYKAGQTAYVPLIPRHPVVELPTSAIANGADGNRRVQVVRQQVVRDVPIQPMGSVGANRIFASGPFAPGDEVIYEASHQLADGFQLRPSAAPARAAAAAGTPGASSPTAPAGNPGGAAPKPTPPKTTTPATF